MLEWDVAHREIVGATRTKKKPFLYIDLSCLSHTYLCEFQNQYLQIPINELRSWNNFNYNSSEIVPSYCWSHVVNRKIPFFVYTLWIQAQKWMCWELAFFVKGVAFMVCCTPNHTYKRGTKTFQLYCNTFILKRTVVCSNTKLHPSWIGSLDCAIESA